MDHLRELKDQAARAMGRSQWKQAYTLYEELAKLDPKEGTWPLRAGDAAKHLGDQESVIRWYEIAATTYGQRGFVVRAIAVGKMIQSLDPGNDRVLRLLDAEQRSAQPTQSVAQPAPRAPEKRPTLEVVPEGPPLGGRLSGPPLAPTTELEMQSMEIVFDDVDDGIPLQPSDILAPEDLSTEPEEISEEELIESLPSFPLFQVLPPGAFFSVASEMKQITLQPGEIIVRQGQRGTTLYAIVEGTALVYAEGQRDQPLATLGPGEVFGEMALFLDQKRAATVEALTSLDLFEMNRELFHAVLAQHQELGDILSRMVKRRLVENVMGTAPLFKQLEPKLRKELMFRFEVREVPANTKLVEQGTPSDGLYMILAGTIEATHDGRVTAALDRGQIFGVASLIDASHKSPAGFRAVQHSLVLRLPRSAFHEVISAYPPVLEHIAEVADRHHGWTESDSIPVV